MSIIHHPRPRSHVSRPRNRTRPVNAVLTCHTSLLCILRRSAPPTTPTVPAYRVGGWHMAERRQKPLPLCRARAPLPFDAAFNQGWPRRFAARRDSPKRSLTVFTVNSWRRLRLRVSDLFCKRFYSTLEPAACTLRLACPRQPVPVRGCRIGKPDCLDTLLLGYIAEPIFRDISRDGPRVARFSLVAKSTPRASCASLLGQPWPVVATLIYPDGTE